MSPTSEIRRNWLKGMYIYTLVAAGGSALAMLIAPDFVKSHFDWMAGDSTMFSIVAVVWLAFGLLSILGFREPLKFVPVLALQMLYKSIWIIVVAIPRLIGGESIYVLPTVLFVTYVVGDAIAIPFPYLFGRREAQQTASVTSKRKGLRRHRQV